MPEFGTMLAAGFGPLKLKVEFIAKAIRSWLEQLGVKALYIELGSPWANGYAESFHSKLRDEFLNAEEFASLREARELTREFQESYNHARPQSGLGYETPRRSPRVAHARRAGTFGVPDALLAAIDGSEELVQLS